MIAFRARFDPHDLAERLRIDEKELLREIGISVPDADVACRYPLQLSGGRWTIGWIFRRAGVLGRAITEGLSRVVARKNRER